MKDVWDFRWKNAKRLFAAAVACLLVLALGYWLFVQTADGQSWDNQGYQEHRAFFGTATSIQLQVLSLMNKPLIFKACVFLVLLGTAFRSPVAGGVAALTFGLAVMGAEAWKAHLPWENLNRQFFHLPPQFLRDTYPSGHTTIGMSFGLAMVLVVGARTRVLLTVLSPILGIFFATGVIFLGWHRPSDALGGIFWSGFCFFFAAGCLNLCCGHRHPQPSPDLWILAAPLSAIICLTIGLAVSVADQPFPWRLFLTLCEVVIAAIAVPFALSAAIRTISWRKLKPPRDLVRLAEESSTR